MKSDEMKKGFDKAPQRSLLHALGLTQEEIDRLRTVSDRVIARMRL